MSVPRASYSARNADPPERLTVVTGCRRFQSAKDVGMYTHREAYGRQADNRRLGYPAGGRVLRPRHIPPTRGRPVAVACPLLSLRVGIGQSTSRVRTFNMTRTRMVWSNSELVVDSLATKDIRLLPVSVRRCDFFCSRYYSALVAARFCAK